MEETITRIKSIMSMMEESEFFSYMWTMKYWFDRQLKNCMKMIRQLKKNSSEEEIIQQMEVIFNAFDELNSVALSTYIAKHRWVIPDIVKQSAKMFKETRKLIKMMEVEREEMIEKDLPLYFTSIIQWGVWCMIKSWKDIIHLVDDEDVDEINQTLKVNRPQKVYNAKDLVSKRTWEWKLTVTSCCTQPEGTCTKWECQTDQSK